MNKTTNYTVMLISDYNNSAHMERVEADDNQWKMTLAAAMENRDQCRADGIAAAVVVSRVKVGDQYRFSVVR